MRRLSTLHIEAGLDWDEETTRILAEMEGFQDKGHAVALMAQPTSEIFKRANERKIPVEAVAMDRSNVFRAIWKALRIIHKRRADIIMTHATRDHWIGAAAALLSGRRPIVIRTQHHMASAEKGFINRWLNQKLSHCVICTGDALRKRLIAEQDSLPERTVSVPAGVDLARYSPTLYDPGVMRSELEATDSPLIAMTGVFTSGEGFQDFLAAAAVILKTIPETRFYIVGTGLPPDVMRVRAVIARNGLQNEVFMLGHREDIPQILSAMDLIMHCPSENSGLPEIVLQALAMGKPVAATKVGSVPEAVFDAVTGCLVAPGDVQDLSSRVIDLLQDELKRKAFGQAGRRLMKERYSREGMLDRLEQLCKTLSTKTG